MDSKQGEVKVTFVARPIETAPKDRQVMLFTVSRVWHSGQWDEEDQSWEMRYDTWHGSEPKRKGTGPTHWAEIEDMQVTP